MLDGKGGDGEVVLVEQQAGLDLNQFDRHWRLGAAQNDAEQQIVNALERGLAGVQLKIVDRLPAHKGGKQARQAEDVIEVGVGDEDAVEALEADAALKNLALGAFAAIHQKAVLVVHDHL